jgi:hypothetical protein
MDAVKPPALQYDPSRMHPVFFATSLVKPQFSHPQMSGMQAIHNPVAFGYVHSQSRMVVQWKL